jgi:CheY-like chemotaxis protein
MQKTDLKPVLIAEDDGNDLYLIIAAFEEARMHCPLITVRNGAQAVDYLAGNGEYANRLEHPIPVIMLLDIKMPVMDGFEVLEWLRDQDRFPELLVMVLSGSSLTEDIRKAKALGAAAYRVKPCGYAEYVTLAAEIRDEWLEQPTCTLRSGAKEIEFFRT